MALAPIPAQPEKPQEKLARALRLLAEAFEELAAPAQQGSPNGGDVMLTVGEAAKRLHASYWFVRGEIKRGSLPAVRLGRRYWRVRAEDLEAYVRRRSGRLR
jgi:excisionase family DNA binding protein